MGVTNNRGDRLLWCGVLPSCARLTWGASRRGVTNNRGDRRFSALPPIPQRITANSQCPIPNHQSSLQLRSPQRRSSLPLDRLAFVANVVSVVAVAIVVFVVLVVLSWRNSLAYTMPLVISQKIRGCLFYILKN